MVFVIVGVGVLAAVYLFIRYNRRTGEMNADPTQQQLVGLLAQLDNPLLAPSVTGRIVTLAALHGWSRSERNTRLAHACSVLKVSAPQNYQLAVEYCRAIA